MYYFLVLAGVCLCLIWLYNSMVVAKNNYKNAYALIDIQLKRRHDLIPNLVNVAKSYLTHEKATLEAVINARNHALSAAKLAAKAPGNAQAMQTLAHAENSLSHSLGQFNVTLEAYPDLKASETLQQLSEELGSTENRISFARQSYNDLATDYNSLIETFPRNVLASMFNFKTVDLLQPIEHTHERHTPIVNI